MNRQVHAEGKPSRKADVISNTAMLMMVSLLTPMQSECSNDLSRYTLPLYGYDYISSLSKSQNMLRVSYVA